MCRLGVDKKGEYMTVNLFFRYFVPHIEKTGGISVLGRVDVVRNKQIGCCDRSTGIISWGFECDTGVLTAPVNLMP